MISKLVKFKLSNCNKSYFSNFLYAKFVTLYTMFLLLVLIFLVVLIISIYSVLAFIFTGKAAYGSLFFKVVGASFLALALLMGLRWLGDSVTLKKEDFYGDYVINRDYFPGKNAQWQYEHYKFTIRQDDSLFFYVMNGDSVESTYKGKVNVNTGYASARITFDMQPPVHHVFTEQPMIVRSRWGFTIVMYSPFYNNMYFEKD